MKKVFKKYLEFIGLLFDNYGPQAGSRGSRRTNIGEHSRRNLTLFPIALITLPVLFFLFMPIFIIAGFGKDGGMTSLEEKVFAVYLIFLVVLFLSTIVIGIYHSFKKM